VGDLGARTATFIIHPDETVTSTGRTPGGVSRIHRRLAPSFALCSPNMPIDKPRDQADE
jgi:hypothetical protein